MHSFFDYYQHFIMSKLLLFLLGLLMVVTRGRECESNYTGFYSDLEVANCTNSQIRTHKVLIIIKERMHICTYSK